ncbi:hypothetical protein R80B4_00385 [Fibrobacteres bacterium R8-0-B4]
MRGIWRSAAAAMAAVFVSAAAEPVPVSGTFTDTRNDRVYNTMKVGAKTWMADNINFETGNSWCYDGDSTNCNAYGRLYDLTTATAACPSGWRLPTLKEFGLFIKAVNDREAAKYAKVKKTGGAEAEFRFPPILGGGRYRIGGEYSHIGGYSYWWATTGNANIYAYFRYVGYGHDDTPDDFDVADYGLSVRCLKD